MFFSFVFFFKQKTAYEMRSSDWSSDVFSSDLKTCNTTEVDQHMSSLLFPLLILALLVPMFLGMRKQKKALAATSEMQDSLQVGDRVQTTAGLYATIASLDDDTVDLEIAEDRKSVV